MPETFSWTLAFRSSYRLNTTSNVFLAIIIKHPSTQARNTMAARNIMLSLGLIINDITMLHTSISGERTAILMHIW